MYKYLCKLYRKLTPTCDEVVGIRVRSVKTNEPRIIFFVYAKLFNLIPIRILIVDQSIQNKMAEMVKYGHLKEGDDGRENLRV